MVGTTIAPLWTLIHKFFTQGFGHSTPQLVQAVAILLGTFVLEDAATVLAAMSAQDGRITIPLALVALYAGIVLGDLGLYGLGRLSSQFPWVRRFVPEPRADAARAWLCVRVFRVVLISRFIPGMRLPTYTACGYLHASFKKFALAAVVATLVWTSMLFSLSLRVGQFLVDHLGAWKWLGAAGFALTIVIAGRFAARLQQVER